MRVIKHILVVCAALFICLGLPCLHFVNAGTLFADGADAAAGASMVVPDQPSGTFLVLLNRSRHPLTESEWQKFFEEKDVDVIMEDLHCMVIRGDVTGMELADRYRARLAENQMRIVIEDGTLIASRTRYGLFDAVVVSAEAAEAFGLDMTGDDPDLAAYVIGGTSP